MKQLLDTSVYDTIICQLGHCIRKISLDHAQYTRNQTKTLIQNTPELKKVFNEWRNEFQDEKNMLYKIHNINVN